MIQPLTTWRTPVPEFIERVNESQARAKRYLPEIPLSWAATTIPTLPDSIYRLPIDASLSLGTDGIHMHARREGYLTDDSVEEVDVFFHKDDIVGVDIKFMPELPDGTDMQYVTLADFSRAVIRHRDPFQVVPFFESTFTASNTYWLKALAKAVKERLGVEPSVMEAHE
jgi:hypothetical protein